MFENFQPTQSDSECKRKWRESRERNPSSRNVREELRKHQASIDARVWDKKPSVAINKKTLLDADITRIGRGSVMAWMLNGGKEDIGRKKGIDVNEIESINFYKALDRAWQMKLRKYGARNPWLHKFYQERIIPFTRWGQNFSAISRTDFNNKVSHALNNVDKHLELNTIFSQDPLRKKTFLKIKEIMGVNQVIAVMYSEMIDSQNPKKANTFFNFILNNAGEEFLELFPAMWDKYLSYGPAQFTKFTIGKDGSAIAFQDDHLSANIIAENMRDIKKQDHYEGIYIIMLSSLQWLLRSLDKNEIRKLEKYIIQSPEKARNLLVQYIAAAHNGPTAAKRAFIWHIHANIRNDTLNVHGRKEASNNAKKAKKNERKLSQSYPHRNG